MFIKPWCCAVAASGLLALSLSIQTSAQKSADTSSTLKAVLTIESDTLTRKQPANVTLKLENVSGGETVIESSAAFELRLTTQEAIARKFSVFGDSYWSPADLLTATPLKLDADPKMLKKGVVQGTVPEAILHFSANETKAFSLDLTKLNWNASLGNDWPRWNLFEAVPKGSYSLMFRMNELKSNEVKVTVE